MTEAQTNTVSQGTEEREAPRSNAERAYGELRRRILANDLPAGTQALEQELAGQLGMSRTPVREAMIRLEEDGLVEVRPRHGMRVLPISPADMREIYELLTELEPAAARMVAERGATPDQLAELERAVGDMDIALAADDLDSWAEADARFHRCLVDFSGNRRLLAVVNMFWDQAHRARMITLRMRPKPAHSNKDHSAVVSAIKRGDAAAAEEIHRNHRKKSGAMLLELLERFRLTLL